jgi:prolyl-tRNA synthetase
MGVEVLYDDRAVRPGFMFADADLFGIPVRVVISPKTLERNSFEISYRDKSFKGDIAIDNAAPEIKAMVEKLLAEYNI